VYTRIYPDNSCLNSYNCLSFRLDSENRIVDTVANEKLLKLSMKHIFK